MLFMKFSGKVEERPRALTDEKEWYKNERTELHNM